MKIVIVKIDAFNGGMSDDVREQKNGVFTKTVNFDIFSNPKRMTPYRDTETDDVITGTSSTMTEFKVQNFESVSGKLFGLGRKNSGSTLLRILEKSDPTGGAWALSATATQTGIGVPIRDCFKAYKGYLHGLKPSGAGTANKADVWKYGSVVSGTRVLTEAFGGADVLTIDDSSLTRVAQGFIGKDDNLYLPYENKLARATSSAVTAAVLTLPTDYTITSGTSWGNYAAVGCKPNVTTDNSKVYLWDYVSDDITQVVDFGRGDLKVLENLEETLIGVLDVGGANASALFRKVQIVGWAGGAASIIHEVDYTFSGVTVQTPLVPIYKQRVGNKLHIILYDGVSYHTFVIGRRASGDSIACTYDRYLSNGTAVDTVNAFYLLGDFLFASIGTNGNIRKTNDSSAYTASSIYKSQKFNAGDLTKVKQLKGVALGFAPVPSGGAIALDYRVNATSKSDLISTWTQIFSHTTQGSYYREASKVEATNREFSDGYEFEFRIRSTGNVEPVEFKPVFEVVDNQLEE